MRKMLLAGSAIGAAGWLLRRRRPAGPPDLTTDIDGRPQAPIERIEREVDVPGGVRP